MTKPDEDTDKIHEALSLLNEAAREKQEELGSLLHGKYDDLKKTILDLESEAVHQARHGVNQTEAMSHEVIDRLRDTAERLDRRAHEDPWKALGWSVAGAFVAGYLFGRKD